MTPCRPFPGDDFGPKGGSFRKAVLVALRPEPIVNCSIRRCKGIAGALRHEADILFGHPETLKCLSGLRVAVKVPMVAALRILGGY